MSHETVQLAKYAASLRYEDLPPEVIQRAKDCIIDTAGAIFFGVRLPWSQIVVEYAKRYGAGGKSHILGDVGPAVQAPAAALANGTLSHAFELDSVTKPPAGFHPGGALLAASLAVAQERGIGGRDFVVAIVAGFELGYRIGRATKHTNETRGFHGPGTTGPFAAAAGVGRLLQLDAAKMTNALGIAGSMAGGLMEFARSGTGAMVKRLHLGRAAESGVVAAILASDGFTGPVSVLEGKAGFLSVFCDEWDISELTKGLGKDFGTLYLCTKRFACHIQAHTSVQAAFELRTEQGFVGADVSRVLVEGTDRMATTNNIRFPSDIMMAQYSVPFCVALALTRDPRDPASFSDNAITDPNILSLCERVEVRASDRPMPHGSWASSVTITLKDGRTFKRLVEQFKGEPENPFSENELHEKFVMLTRGSLGSNASSVFERLQNIEKEKDLSWFGA